MSHADEARDLLQPLQALAGKDAAFDLELAVALATLELAEQARIANIIALNASTFLIGKEKVQIQGLLHDVDGKIFLSPDIATALKIGNRA